MKIIIIYNLQYFLRFNYLCQRIYNTLLPYVKKLPKPGNVIKTYFGDRPEYITSYDLIWLWDWIYLYFYLYVYLRKCKVVMNWIIMLPRSKRGHTTENNHKNCYYIKQSFKLSISYSLLLMLLLLFIKSGWNTNIWFLFKGLGLYKHSISLIN